MHAGAGSQDLAAEDSGLGVGAPNWPLGCAEVLVDGLVAVRAYAARAFLGMPQRRWAMPRISARFLRSALTISGSRGLSLRQRR